MTETPAIVQKQTRELEEALAIVEHAQAQRYNDIIESLSIDGQIAFETAAQAMAEHGSAIITFKMTVETACYASAMLNALETHGIPCVEQIRQNIILGIAATVQDLHPALASFATGQVLSTNNTSACNKPANHQKNQ